ncbi:phosphotransferase family protein [Devosia albogilva]|uniref:Phosphotransferase family protein n=1 Tax=Devosia albogilva TaxID=429726 RepID=A0ABW5QPW7_9HYPH
MLGEPIAAEANLQAQPLTGGTEANEAVLYTVRYRDPAQRTLRVVVKSLSGRPAREAQVYAHLVQPYAAALAPRLLAVKRDGDQLFLVMEAVRPNRAWPWRDNAATVRLLHELGRFHARVEGRSVSMPGWDYDGELAESGQAAVHLLDQCRAAEELRPLVRHLTVLRRFAENAARLRRQLLVEAPFHGRPIHGDVHSGNALFRGSLPGRPVLFDWGRARHGSPLEDVSSVLQSLRQWEPEAMSAHDTLLRRYLSALGLDARLADGVRSAYWVAAACNLLSGALTVHLWHALEHGGNEQQKAQAIAMAHNCLRVVRRAHAWAF